MVNYKGPSGTLRVRRRMRRMGTLIDHEPEFTVTPLAAHEPGCGKVDYV